ncbi:MAG: hypothetical protein O7E52_13960 [Candidatus Poribacteria bacterium]|nr:hypothetical protein [Candidatus Poribacteria bacterium]
MKQRTMDAKVPLDQLNISDEVMATREEMVAIRRDLHKHPELGFQEVRTAKIVEETLRASGIRTQTGVAHTGVVGLLEGSRPGKTILVRVDMDALPI